MSAFGTLYYIFENDFKRAFFEGTLAFRANVRVRLELWIYGTSFANLLDHSFLSHFFFFDRPASLMAIAFI